MSQKAKHILQRIKAKLSGRSKNSKRYSRDVPQGNGDSNGPLDSHFTNLDRGNAGTRPTTAGTERHQKASSLVNKTDARQNELRVVNNGTDRESVDENFKSVYLNDYHFADLGRDETGSRPATATGPPITAQNDPQVSNKERRGSNTLPENYGSASSRRRSDTAESVSIPRKPVRGSHGGIAGTNGTEIQEELKTNGRTLQGEPRPDSMAIPIGGYSGSVGSGSMSLTEETDGTQQLISLPDFGKSSFADFDLTNTVDTDHHTYKAPGKPSNRPESWVRLADKQHSCYTRSHPTPCT